MGTHMLLTICSKRLSSWLWQSCKAVWHICKLQSKRWRKVSWELVVFRYDVADCGIHGLDFCCFILIPNISRFCLAKHLTWGRTIRPCLISTARRRLKVASSSEFITFGSKKDALSKQQALICEVWAQHTDSHRVQLSYRVLRNATNITRINTLNRTSHHLLYLVSAQAQRIPEPNRILRRKAIKRLLSVLGRKS